MQSSLNHFYGHKGPQRKVPLLVQFMEILKVSGHYGFDSRASTFFDYSAAESEVKLSDFDPIQYLGVVTNVQLHHIPSLTSMCPPTIPVRRYHKDESLKNFGRRDFCIVIKTDCYA